jgi:hypothetical protein
MLVGLQMNNRGLVCPACGHQYAALYIGVRSTCPSCKAEIQTNLRTIGIIETIIGAPLLWLLATFLRIWLNDESGVASYALLVPVAFAVHFFVVRYFVRGRVITGPPSSNSELV